MFSAQLSTFSLEVIHREERGLPEAAMAAAMVGCEP
jgi:hypothetical protein